MMRIDCSTSEFDLAEIGLRRGPRPSYAQQTGWRLCTRPTSQHTSLHRNNYKTPTRSP
ncbi:hypothetical protein EMIT0158MI4_160177 [Burkholderia ambifaria]